jgi:hypothetical protein
VLLLAQEVGNREVQEGGLDSRCHFNYIL